MSATDAAVPSGATLLRDAATLGREQGRLSASRLCSGVLRRWASPSPWCGFVGASAWAARALGTADARRPHFKDELFERIRDGWPASFVALDLRGVQSGPSRH